MKKELVFILIMLASFVAKAYDFNVNGIFYNILSASDKTIEVTKNDGDTSIYTGSICIPKDVVYENIKFDVIAIGEEAFINSTVTDVDLPESISAIKDYAFSNCSKMKKCILPESLTSIGRGAFLSTDLDSVTIPGGVNSFGQGCFTGCSMSYLEISEGVSVIPRLTFYNCPYLKTLVLPASLTKIGAASFLYCSNLRTIISKRETSPAMYDSYWFSGSSTHTTYNPFTYSDSEEKPIYTLLVPNGSTSSYANYRTSGDGKLGWPVATIEEYDESTDFSKISTEFVQENMMYAITNTGNHNTVQLVKTMVDSVTELIIRDKIFRNSIEYAVTSINPNFICTNKELRKVHAYSTVPISVYENTFSANTKLFGTLYVPEQAKNLYENATEWKDFTSIVESNEVIPPTPNPKCATPIISFVNGQLMFDCETADVTYVSSVICEDNKNYNTAIIPLTSKYIISVYATKDGYDDSDIVTKVISIRGLKGDVNEDGEINIADVNTVIDKILTGNN